MTDPRRLYRPPHHLLDAESKAACRRLLALGAAAIIRDSAAATGAVLALLYLPPIIAAALASNPHWQHEIDRYAPMNAGLTIQNTTGLHGLPISPWAGLGVLAAWAAAVLLTSGLVLRLRDA